MGTWGVGIFEDDLTVDVREVYHARVSQGEDNVNVAQSILEGYRSDNDDPDDYILVCIALAMLLHESVSAHPIIDKAKSYLLNEQGLEKWQEQGESLIADRKKEYLKILKKLNSPAINTSLKRMSGKSVSKNPIIGDIIRIPLENGNYYCHYVYDHESHGPLIKVFEYLGDEPSQEQLRNASILLGPVFCNIFRPLKLKRWEIAGHIEITDFKPPLFLNVIRGKEGVIFGYWLWGNGKEKKLGANVPREYLNLELDIIWSAEGLEERIKTGVNPLDPRK